MNLTSTNSRTENITIETVVVPELELCNVKMQIFLADVVESADDTALDDRPESLNRIRVNRAHDIFLGGVVYGGVRISLLAETVIANPLIGAEQANFVRDSFAYEGFQCGGLDVSDHASDDVALAADRSGDDCALAASGGTRHSVTLVSVFVLGFAADEGFVNFDNTAKLFFRLDQSNADFVSHKPSGFDRTEAHVAAKLPRAHALFAGQDQVSDLEPVTERLVRVFEDRPGQMGEPIAVRGALFALPMMTRGERIAFVVTTTRAFDAIRPATSDQIADAGIFVANREKGVELGRSQLMDGFGAFYGGHGNSSFVGGYCHVR